MQLLFLWNLPCPLPLEKIVRHLYCSGEFSAKNDSLYNFLAVQGKINHTFNFVHHKGLGQAPVGSINPASVFLSKESETPPSPSSNNWYSSSLPSVSLSLLSSFLSSLLSSLLASLSTTSSLIDSYLDFKKLRNWFCFPFLVTSSAVWKIWSNLIEHSWKTLIANFCRIL